MINQFYVSVYIFGHIDGEYLMVYYMRTIPNKLRSIANKIQ